MKRLILLFTLVVFALCANAQSVTKFLGIPVDGFEYTFKSKLREKGFKDSWVLEGALEGEFNGRQVFVEVQTVKDKVWRVIVSDVVTLSEEGIKNRFNNLLYQFKRNKKYHMVGDDPAIPEEEKISTEMLVSKKRYEATFLQFSEEDMKKGNNFETAMNAFNRLVWFIISEGSYDSYRIVMYYENSLNEADGSDL